MAKFSNPEMCRISPSCALRFSWHSAFSESAVQASSRASDKLQALPDLLPQPEALKACRGSKRRFACPRAPEQHQSSSTRSQGSGSSTQDLGLGPVTDVIETGRWGARFRRPACPPPRPRQLHQRPRPTRSAGVPARCSACSRSISSGFVSRLCPTIRSAAVTRDLLVLPVSSERLTAS